MDPRQSPVHSPGTCRTRAGRISEPGRIYHIIGVTYRRRPIFLDLRCARTIIQILRKEQERGFAETLSFVIMPDHFHWLFQLGQGRGLSQVVNSVKSESARRINRLGSRRGRVWQKGYFDRAIRTDDDVVSVARYIVANPLRAGLVEAIGDYPHWDSSWIPG